MTKKKIGALFDLDGVLLDSEGIYTQFWDAVEAVYPTHIPNFSTVIKGSNLFEILHDNYPDDETRQKVGCQRLSVVVLNGRNYLRFEV